MCAVFHEPVIPCSIGAGCKPYGTFGAVNGIVGVFGGFAARTVSA